MSKTFIYQIEKEEKENFIELTFYSINEKKDTIITKKQVPYTILALKEEFEKLNLKSDSIILSEKQLFNKKGEEIIQININSKEMHEYVLSLIKTANFNTFEADLPTEHQYLIDNKLNLTENDEYIPPKYVTIDIESIGIKNQQEIVLISTYSPNISQICNVYVNKAKMGLKKIEKLMNCQEKNFNLVIKENEKEILEQFRKDLIDFKPQMILGWNVIDFDFKVIKERMDFYSIPFNFSEYEGDTKLRIYSDFFKTSTMTCPGVLIFDVIALLKMNFIIFEDYKLDTVAKEVLKDEKIDLEEDIVMEDGVELNKLHLIEKMIKENPSKLIEYNFKDSYLTSKIVENQKLIELICKRSIITGTPLSKIKSPIATLDIMYLKQLHEKGLVAPTNFNFNETSPIEGAYVITPEKNFYEDIYVMDFKSLYPSIIMTFNIDPFTYNENGQIEAPNGAKFDKEAGILPNLIHRLYLERDNAKKENDKVKSFALKTTMNSFYGAVASPKSRFYNKDVGEAITSFGQHIIKKAKEHLENLGHKVIYGDTDSVFIKLNREFKNLDEKFKAGQEVEKELNSFFENWVNQEFGQKSFLSIEFEKIFSKFFIASKKRYVGYDEISKQTIYTGMEAIRGDWTELAKSFQVNLVNQIFEGKSKKDIEEYILQYVDNLKKGKYDDMLVYKKKLTKPLNAYTKTTPPHVKAARELKEITSRLVKYVMTKDGPKHVRLLGDQVNYDYEHYIDKQLKGVSDDLLETFGIDFDKVVMSKKQTSLNRFF